MHCARRVVVVWTAVNDGVAGQGGGGGVAGDVRVPGGVRWRPRRSTASVGRAAVRSAAARAVTVSGSSQETGGAVSITGSSEETRGAVRGVRRLSGSRAEC